MGEVPRENLQGDEDANNVKPEAEVPEDFGEIAKEVGEIGESPDLLAHETEARLQQIIENSGLSPEAVDEVKGEVHLDERLGQNASQARRLSHRTIDSIKSLVEAMSGGASEQEREALFKKFGLEAEAFGLGAFYNAYNFNEPSAAGEPEIVFKELKLNYLFGQEEAVKMLARHEIEAERIRECFGDEFVPEFYFVYPKSQRKTFEKEKIKKLKGGKLYDIATFGKIQIDRRLQRGFKKRDVEHGYGITEKAFQWAGKKLRDSRFFREETAGAMVQERVRGITFADCLQKFNKGNCEKWKDLKKSVGKFLEKSKKFNEKHAMLWHRLDSDNIVVEVDENGNPTGRIRIIDMNFTERPAELVRKAVNRKTERKIWKPLRQAFEIEEE